jgi:hypothetical protein
MLPWRNSWFQIAFFAWVVSGALLIVDYAPKIPANSGWMQAFHREPRPPSEAPAKFTPPSKGPAPEKEPAHAPPAPSSDSELPTRPIEDESATKAPAVPAMQGYNASRTKSSSAELALGNTAHHLKDYAQAMQWYQKAAAQGNAEAEDKIGLLYHEGGVVMPNGNEDWRWFEKSASHGNAQGEFHLGAMYEKAGQYTDAVKWIHNAALQGHGEAEFYMGNFYERGLGVQKDDAEAVRWYQKAAAQRVDQAKGKVAELQTTQKSP